MKIVVAVVAAILAVAFVFYAFGPYPPFWVQSRIRSSMTEWARDPGSLQFSDLRYSDDDNDIICGKMNAKNSLGAYTGFKTIAYARSGNFTFVEGLDSSADRMISLFKCN